MVLQLIRMFFVAAVLAISISFATSKELLDKGPEYVTVCILVPFVAAVGLVLADVFWRRKRLGVLSGLFFGVLSGLVIAYVLALIVDMVLVFFPAPPKVENPGLSPKEPRALAADATPEQKADYQEARQAYARQRAEYEFREAAYDAYMSHFRSVQLAKLLVGAVAVFLCVTFVFQTRDDFRFVIPYVEFFKQTKGVHALLLDTSAVIDGRIADVAETAVLDSEVLVPRFVLSELQAVADSDDRLKRNRGRRGLDVLNRLQACRKVDVRITDPHSPELDAASDVDAKLLVLAQETGARIVTTDFNLSKVAQVRGVKVMNLNDLANSLKPVVLPGERLTVKVIRPGEEAGQGVGYLDDGTMVVAEQAREHVGQAVEIVVTSVLQTSAGKMIFGRSEGPTAAKV